VTEDLCAVGDQRPASLGLLCTEHGVRLADHYGAREGLGDDGRIHHGLPWMWDNLQVAYPSLSGQAGNAGKSDIDDPEAQKLAAVIDLRRDIEHHLVITARELAEDIGRSGPDLATTARLRVQRAARWLVANLEPLRAAQGARATEEDLRAASLAATRQFYEDNGLEWDIAPGAIIQGSFITEAIDAAHAGAKAEAVRALLAEADDLASRAHALAPWREAPTRIEGVPCRCGAVGTIHDFGDVRKCGRCGASFDELHWAALTKAMAHRFSEEGQTA
jgi:hypothetical protein